jgi:uncharacterized protein (TIGR03435 family)
MAKGNSSASSVIVLACLTAATPLCAAMQARQQHARVEAASVKQNPAGGRASRRVSPSGISWQSASLPQMIQWAYDVPPANVVALPEWARTSNFDVAVRSSEPIASASDARTLLRTVLEERFGVVVEETRRRQPVYELKLLNSSGGVGPRLQPSESGNCADGAFSTKLPPPPAARFERNPELGRPCGFVVATADGRISMLGGRGVTMGEVARTLSDRLDRTVVDRTGLAGRFDVTVIPTGSAESISRSADIFVLMREQLGIDLHPADAEVDVLVVRDVRRPSPN